MKLNFWGKEIEKKLDRCHNMDEYLHALEQVDFFRPKCTFFF